MSDVNICSCFFCGHFIDPHDKYSWHRVIGWERRGKAGGSDITLREPRDEHACSACISIIKSGVAPTQESLI